MVRKNDQKAYEKSIKCPPAAPACADCGPPKHPCPQDMILNCCTGTGLGQVFIPEPGPFQQTPAPLVCAEIDTTCLCNPMVKVRFDCIPSVSLGSGQISLVFLLKKSCDNGQEIECGTWTYRRSFALAFGNDSFGFTFCDCNPCPGCCTYFVELLLLDEQGGDIIGVIAPTLKVEAVDTCGIKDAACLSGAPAYADCKPKHPCPQGAVFNCCTGTGIPTTSVCPSTPRSLVCVSLDTTCLCKPLVELDFSAVIAADVPQGDLLTLTFQVKKSCDNGREMGCGTWTFTRAAVGAIVTDQVATSDSFRFTFCDCNPCPGCCTYAVELLSCIAVDLDLTPFEGNFSINAPTAAVWAVDTCPQ